MATVTFENVSRVFPGTERPALANLELAVNDGEFLVLVGPSGCGKSTTLRLLAGLDRPTDGRILLDGEDITNKAPQERDTAMVFQNYALYPHMNVRDNMGYSLKVAGIGKTERYQRVDQVAQMLNVEELLHRKPGQLSGGQRQRVAMGRALVREPQAFLLDEPLSNLDASLRLRTRTQISDLTSRLGITTLYVTHDQSEAMTMADRVAVLRDGLLQQVAAPEEIYDRPANAFVASFIGNPGMNLVVADASENKAVLGQLTLPLSGLNWPADVKDRSRVIVGIRPEDFTLVSESTPGLAAEVVISERHGATHLFYCRSLVAPLRYVQQGTIGSEEDDDMQDQAPLFAVQLQHRQEFPAIGERVRLAPTDPNHVHFFEVDGGQRLN